MHTTFSWIFKLADGCWPVKSKVNGLGSSRRSKCRAFDSHIENWTVKKDRPLQRSFTLDLIIHRFSAIIDIRMLVWCHWICQYFLSAIKNLKTNIQNILAFKISYHSFNIQFLKIVNKVAWRRQKLQIAIFGIILSYLFYNGMNLSAISIIGILTIVLRKFFKKSPQIYGLWVWEFPSFGHHKTFF